MTRAMIIDPRDDVAVVLEDTRAGDEIVARRADGTEQRVTARQDITFGFKVALRALSVGAPVHKYGEVIGSASAAIQPGDVVHIHNLAGGRGRGDLAVGAQPAGARL